MYTSIERFLTGKNYSLHIRFKDNKYWAELRDSEGGIINDTGISLEDALENLDDFLDGIQ